VTLSLDAEARVPGRRAVTLRGLHPDMTATLDRLQRAGLSYQSVLSVRVVGRDEDDDDIPRVGGHHELLDDGLVFVPHFGFEPGTLYRASFTPPHHPAFRNCAPLSLAIRVTVQSAVPSKVLGVFPSGDQLPENLLRLYVRFSESMRRGQADAQIGILGPDGNPAPDILYRAPVELWDREMRCLTVLLDPGRLKRGVGPNRELGPPLKAGREYTLVVGAGMTDRSGQHLPHAFTKRFLATEAVRKAVEIDEWLVSSPAAGTLDPLRLVFPAVLDWGMLDYAIRVVDRYGQPVGGHRETGLDESCWTHTPATPWEAGGYRVVVSPELEDVCGNSLLGAFDRDVSLDTGAACPPDQSIPVLLS
jgi:hypothetical protein